MRGTKITHVKYKQHMFFLWKNGRSKTQRRGWTQEETILLIELWADERVQEQLENTPRRNIEIFKRICEDIKDRIPDFQRSPQECQAWIKHLKTMYFQTKRANNKSGGKRRSFPYYERLDALLNTRPSYSYNPQNPA